MQRLLIGLMLLVWILPSASCTKEMMQYEGMEGIYFAARSGPYYADSSSWAYRPYTNVEFVRHPETVTELNINIKVQITGPMKDYARPFIVEVNPDSTTAVENVHYKSFPRVCIVPANSIFGYIPVTLVRTTDMLEDVKILGLKLVANEHFGLAFPEWKHIPGVGDTNVGTDTAFDARFHVIRVSDMLVRPEVWRGSLSVSTNKETGLWGVFSRKKILLMCELFHLKYEDFGKEETMPLALSTLIAMELQRYLVNQFNAGTPVLENDGRLMWAGSVPWSSTPGVPYQ